jgi:hypothetical protein
VLTVQVEMRPSAGVGPTDSSSDRGHTPESAAAFRVAAAVQCWQHWLMPAAGGFTSCSNKQVGDTQHTAAVCVQVFVEDMDIDGTDVEHAVRWSS